MLRLGCTQSHIALMGLAQRLAGPAWEVAPNSTERGWLRWLSLTVQREPAKTAFNMLSADVIRGRCGVWPAHRRPAECEQCSEPANTAQLTLNNRCQSGANMPSTMSSPCCQLLLAYGQLIVWGLCVCSASFPEAHGLIRSMHGPRCRAVSRRTITPSTAVADLPGGFACRQLLQCMAQRGERHHDPFLLKRLSDRGRPNGAWARSF